MKSEAAEQDAYGVRVPLRDALAYVVTQSWRLNRLRLAFISASALVRGLLPIATIAILVFAVDQVAALVGGDQSQVASLVGAVVAQVVLTTVVALLSDIARRRQRRLEYVLRFDAESRLFDALATLDMSRVESPSTQAALNRMRVAAASLPALVSSLLSLLTVATTVVVLLVAAARVHWVVAATLSIAAVAGMFAPGNTAERQFEHQRQRSRTALEADYWLNLMISPFAALEIRAFALADWVRARWSSAVIALSREDQRGDIISDSALLASQLAGAVIGLIVLGLLVWVAALGVVTLSGFVGVVAMATQTISAGQQAWQLRLSLLTSLLGLAELLGFASGRASSHPGSGPYPGLNHELTVRGVTFRYPATTKPALDSVSCWIPARKRTLIIGPNGAGKSTLAKIICGLYAPTFGEVSYDGTSLDDISLAALRGHIACLLQGYVYHDAAISENIRMGDVTAEAVPARIEDAAVAATAATFIKELPESYATRLGRWFWTDGFIPSHGQRVRLALARTLFRAANLYVLDEPTTGLDPVAERAVIEQLGQIDATVVIVSHHMAFQAIADHVICLDYGRVVAQGSPEKVAGLVPWFAPDAGALEEEAVG